MVDIFRTATEEPAHHQFSALKSERYGNKTTQFNFCKMIITIVDPFSNYS
jgi:hypothetical protein